MQQDLDGEALPVPIHIAGMNAAGTEDGVLGMVEGRMIPLFQETYSDDVGALWGVQHFDMVVLDSQNVIVKILDLRENDLTDPTHFEAVKAMLREVAATSPAR